MQSSIDPLLWTQDLSCRLGVALCCVAEQGEAVVLLLTQLLFCRSSSIMLLLPGDTDRKPTRLSVLFRVVLSAPLQDGRQLEPANGHFVADFITRITAGARSGQAPFSHHCFGNKSAF